MSAAEELRIKPRACIEHFKSTPRKRKTYTTLGYTAFVNHEGQEEVRLIYRLDYGAKEVVDRPIAEFDDIMEAEHGERIIRFEVVAENVISPEDRDKALDEYYKDK
jgi:hypothetical protein